MKFSEMKMTVTLSVAEIKELVAEAVSKEIGREVDPSSVSLNCELRSHGDQRDSWQTAEFKNVTVEVKGKIK